MPVRVNLRHIEEKNLQLQGDLAAEELEMDGLDELIHMAGPVSYDVEAQQLEHALLVQGRLSLDLDCECARCLKPFRLALRLEHWVCHLPLTGEEKVEVTNDCVDLTPFLREDMVLAFPQHPLCGPDCGGLARTQQKPEGKHNSTGKSAPASSAWAALDKLKL
jgi:uncharacterized protein